MNSAINAVGASLAAGADLFLCRLAFSKIEFTGRKWIYVVVMCLAISVQVRLFRCFTYIRQRICITHIAVILSECLITIPFGSYDEELLMACRGIDESANVDGANIVQTLFKIYLPLQTSCDQSGSIAVNVVISVFLFR